MPASPTSQAVTPTEPPLCSTCGKERGAGPYCSNAFHIVPEEPPAELKTLLDALEDAVDRLAVDYSTSISRENLADIREAELEVGRIHVAIEALFDRQREALEMFRDEQSRDKAQVASLSSQLECAIKERKFAASSALLLDDQFKQVCAELESERSQLERLKAEQLTAEEARVLTKWCDYYSLATEPMFGKTYPAIEKLRRLSQSDTGDTNG